MQERPLTTINQAGEDSAPVFEVEEPTDGQVLAYDGDSGKWKNADAGGGGGGGVLITTATVTETAATFDKTAGEIYEAFTSGVKVIMRVPVDESQYADYSIEWISVYDDGTTGFTFSTAQDMADASGPDDYPVIEYNN